jgi:hypothetical protein
MNIKNRTPIDLEHFAEAYNNFEINFGPGLSEPAKRKELAKSYEIHTNTVKMLIKRAKDANLIHMGLYDEPESHWDSEEIPLNNPDINNPNFFVHAKSTLYDKDGNIKLEWVKTKLDELKLHQAMSEAITGMMDGFEGKYVPRSLPTFADGDLMTFYPIPDAHLGLLIDSLEVTHGYDWNLKRAKDTVYAGMEYLVKSAPYSRECVITDLGDLLEASDDDNRTKRSKNVLHTSDMHSRIIQVTFELITSMIELALTKHEIVHFYSVPGNHADLIPIYLSQYLGAYFRNEPRVNINTGNQGQKYHRFGKTLLGFAHGHMMSPDKCTETLIHDNRDIFSEIQYCYYHFGHYHSAKKLTEMSLVNIEIHKNLLPTNSWANVSGYRAMSIGEAKAITYHQEYGEVSRSTFNMHLLD